MMIITSFTDLVTEPISVKTFKFFLYPFPLKMWASLELEKAKYWLIVGNM